MPPEPREKMSELVLAKRVVDHLEAQGFTVYQEVQLEGPRADIVAVKGKLLIVVECKTKLSFELLAQAQGWIPHANRVYIAVPIATKTFPAMYGHPETRMEGDETAGRRLACQLVRHLKLGMLEVAHDDIVKRYCVRPIHQRVPAAFREVGSELRDALEPEHQTHAQSGTNRGGHWTPHKRTCAAVRAYLVAHPEASLLETMRAVDHHYRGSARVAAKNLAATVDKGVAPGLKRDPVSGRIVPS